MKILFVLYDHPFSGHTGVSMYCRDVIPGLVARGVEVGVICVHHRDWRLRPYVRQVREHDVTLFQIANASLHPENSLHLPRQDYHHPATELLIRSCLNQFRPDIFHVQTFHGYPGAIVSLAEDLGIPTVISLHDFWAICPQVLLIRPNDQACDGPNGGRNCMQFCVRKRPLRQRLYQWGAHLPDGFPRQSFFLARSMYRWLTRSSTTLWTQQATSRPMDNLGLLREHAHRSRASLSALNSAHEILAVSDFVKSVFVRHGIAENRIRTLPPALSLEGITWKERYAPSPQIRFGFLGRLVPLKGAHVFAQACRGLPRDRARFLMFGPADPETEGYLRRLAGDDALEFRGRYTREALPHVLDEVDVVVVPSVAQETVGLVSLEAQAAGVPVIVSDAGALPEFVRDGASGLIFRSGDANDLRRKMLSVIDDPSAVARMSRHTKPALPLETHLDELLAIYADVVEKGRQMPWTVSSPSSRQAGAVAD